MLARDNIESELTPFYPRLGTTVWSPLAGGVLSGKVQIRNPCCAVPPPPRGHRSCSCLWRTVCGVLRPLCAMNGPLVRHRPVEVAGLVAWCEAQAQVAEDLRPISEELGCSLAQLALAWCLRDGSPVSTVIMGASRLSQLEDNLGALAVRPAPLATQALCFWSHHLKQRVYRAVCY